MSQFDSRDTPIVVGGAQFGFPGVLTDLLSNLVAVPDQANSALVQGELNNTFLYRLDGTTGVGSIECLTATKVYLSNRAQIEQMVVADSGTTGALVVQFYSGRTGPAYR